MEGYWGSYYPDSMTTSEWCKMFGEDSKVRFENSKCATCSNGGGYFIHGEEGCLCKEAGFLSEYEMPGIDDECDYYEEEE